MKRIILLGFLAVFLTAIHSETTAAENIATLRKSHTPCGLYLASVNNGSGVKVADLDFASIDKFFEQNPDLEATISIVKESDLSPITDFETLKDEVVRDGVKTEKKDKYLFLVGLPWPKDQSTPFVEYVNKKVAEKNLKFPPEVIGLRRPSSTGIKRVGEEIRYLAFPLSSDWAKSSEAELKLGMQSVAISSGTTIVTQTIMLGPWIGLPAALMNMLFSISTTIPRPLWMNYFSKHDGTADKWLKQLWMTTYFTAGIYWAGKIFTPEIAQILSLKAWGLMLLAKFPGSILMQTLWRKPMEHGLSTFIEEQTRAGNEKEARRIAASIRRWGTIFSTNAWVLSVLYNKPLFHLGMDWNIGHMGMLLSAAVFMFMEQHPEWYQVESKEFRKEKYASVKLKIGQIWNKLRKKNSTDITPNDDNTPK